MTIQRGFTLIELMIVVAIIGLLSAIAIPAYQDYVVRAKVSEGLVYASEAKNSIVEFYLTNQDMPTQSQSGISNSSTAIVKSVTLTRDSSNAASLSIAFRAIGGTVSDGDALIFTASGNLGQKLVIWECSTASTLEAKYRPNTCR